MRSHLLALLFVCACVPPSTSGYRTFEPGVHRYKGAVELVVTNASPGPVCGVTLAETWSTPTDLRDHLVCVPDPGILMSTGAGSFSQCITPCLAPRESLRFSVKPGKYVMEAGLRGSDGDPARGRSVGAAVEIKGPTKVMLGENPPSRHPGSDVVWINSNQKPHVDIAPEPTRPCTPRGAPYTGNPCCGGGEYYDDRRGIHVCE